MLNCVGDRCVVFGSWATIKVYGIGVEIRSLVSHIQTYSKDHICVRYASIKGL